jgi:hypothetical protein
MSRRRKQSTVVEEREEEAEIHVAPAEDPYRRAGKKQKNIHLKEKAKQ